MLAYFKHWRDPMTATAIWWRNEPAEVQ